MLMTALQTKAKKLPEKPKKKKKGFQAFLSRNVFILLAFTIPFLLMTIGFAIMEVSPFGNNQILVTDLWHQYFPFLVDFQDKLKHGESLFWSWTQGGGVNYFSLMSYYLAGPMNFLCVFIPSQWLREFLMFSVCAKVAFAGCFTAVFLRSVFKKKASSDFLQSRLRFLSLQTTIWVCLPVFSFSLSSLRTALLSGTALRAFLQNSQKQRFSLYLLSV